MLTAWLIVGLSSQSIGVASEIEVRNGRALTSFMCSGSSAAFPCRKASITASAFDVGAITSGALASYVLASTLGASTGTPVGSGAASRKTVTGIASAACPPADAGAVTSTAGTSSSAAVAARMAYTGLADRPLL